MLEALSPWAWAVAAVVIAFLELLAPGYYLIWIACAAAVTAVAAFLADWTLSSQLTIFIAANAVSCPLGFFVYRRFVLSAAGDEPMNRRDLDLVGAVGIAAEAFANGQGRARIGDTVWLAEAADDMPAGTPIVVTGVRGTRLVVGRK